MTRDDIIRMAREAGMVVIGDKYSLLPFLEHFAALVAVAERKTFLSVLRQMHDAYALTSDPPRREHEQR